jgi:transcriptional regulator with XRE-family HTH domain
MTDTSAVAAAVARTVRRLRTERGWSLDALAARAGVSKGVLVGLEQGGANPSLGTLLRVSDAFGVPLTRLVQVDEEPVIRLLSKNEQADLWHGESGGVGTLVAGTDPAAQPGGGHGPAVELWRWHLHPGEARHSEAHRPGCREILLVTAGTVTLTVAGTERELPRGTAAVYHGDAPHTYRNRTDAVAAFTMAVLDV